MFKRYSYPLTLFMAAAVLGCQSMRPPITRLTPAPALPSSVLPSSALRPSALPASAALHVPFRVAGDGLEQIFVLGRVNGTAGYLLLDTGAPDFVLNTAQVRDVPCHPGDGTSTTMGMQVPMLHCDIAQVQWGDVTTNHVTATGQDITQVQERAVSPGGDTFLDTLPLLGIIGLTQLEPYLAWFDYARHDLTLLPLDSAGRPATPLVPAPTDSAPLEITDSWTDNKKLHGTGNKKLRVSGRVGSQTLSWLLDTGSDKTQLGQNATPDSVTAALDAHTVPLLLPGNCTIDTIVIGTLHAPAEHLTVDGLNWHAGETGVDDRTWDGESKFGGPFFTRQPFAINQRTSMLYFWPPNRHPAADSVPLLTADALSRLTAFGTRFMSEPQEIRDSARFVHLQRLSLVVGSQEVRLRSVMNLGAMAAVYPSVAAALAQAGLTVRQWEGYRRALFSAVLAQEGGLAPTIPTTSVLGRNIAFLSAHPDQVDALRKTGMFLPKVRDPGDQSCRGG